MRIPFLLLAAVAGFICGCSDKFVKPVFNPGFSTQWSFSPKGKNDWRPAEVPGTVHTDLFRNNLIPDPMRECRETELKWIARTDFEYQCDWEIPDSLLKYEFVELVFQGLDTYASVFVNDSMLVTADNMFREWRANARPVLKAGKNRIRVMLYSPLRRAESIKLVQPVPLPGGEGEGNGLSLYLRKAAYHFGWDFAPAFVPSGIWLPVTVAAHDGVYIKNMRVNTREIADTSAWMNADVTIVSQKDHPNAVITIRDSFRQFRIRKGETTASIRFRIDHPELWWPNGMGAQQLYELTAKLYINNYLVDTMNRSTGIRTIELTQDEDEWGKGFYFRVNGLPVFMQGANYVPQSPFLTEVTDQDYERLVHDAASAGMNMLRVWGGGIYEKDIFYDLCDKYGILVWQDLMFANGMYPSDPAFLDNVQQEIIRQVSRLQVHPCLALWCGNNEIEVAWKNWGWQQQFRLHGKDSALLWNNYTGLFETKIPEWIASLDPLANYIPGSPISNWGSRGNFNSGNMHYWGVWHGEEPIEALRTHVPRFMTEYGMQSFPAYPVLKSLTDSSRITLGSELMKCRQKSYKQNRLLLDYIRNRYVPAGNVEDLCYLSQLLQAETLEMGVESQRKQARFCMGSLVWQLNDVWDGASWSIADRQGQWKPAYYALQRLYARDLLILESDSDSLHVYLQSMKVQGVSGLMHLEVFDFKGRSLGSFSQEVTAGYLVSGLVYQAGMRSMLQGHAVDSFFVSARFTAADGLSTNTTHFFTAPAGLKLEKTRIRQWLEEYNGDWSLVLVADRFAHRVWIDPGDRDTRLSENLLDLLPGKEYRIRLTGKPPAESAVFTLRSLNDYLGN